jgi:hypothetical protein
MDRVNLAKLCRISIFVWLAFTVLLFGVTPFFELPASFPFRPVLIGYGVFSIGVFGLIPIRLNQIRRDRSMTDEVQHGFIQADHFISIWKSVSNAALVLFFIGVMFFLFPI